MKLEPLSIFQNGPYITHLYQLLALVICKIETTLKYKIVYLTPPTVQCANDISVHL